VREIPSPVETHTQVPSKTMSPMELEMGASDDDANEKRLGTAKQKQKKIVRKNGHKNIA